MKKLISLFLSTVLCLGCLSVICFATEISPPVDGTETPYGVYGIVENIGLSPAPMPRVQIFETDVSLASGKSFTSYQYQVSSGYDVVAVGLWNMTRGSTFKISLYGSNTVGGSKTLLGSVSSSYKGESPFDDAVFKEFSNKYTYYNFVVANTGSVTGTARGTITAD